MGNYEEGSLNIVTLLLSGRATPYLHNGVRQMLYETTKIAFHPQKHFYFSFYYARRLFMSAMKIIMQCLSLVFCVDRVWAFSSGSYYYYILFWSLMNVLFCFCFIWRDNKKAWMRQSVKMPQNLSFFLSSKFFRDGEGEALRVQSRQPGSRLKTPGLPIWVGWYNFFYRNSIAILEVFNFFCSYQTRSLARWAIMECFLTQTANFWGIIMLRSDLNCITTHVLAFLHRWWF